MRGHPNNTISQLNARAIRCRRASRIDIWRGLKQIIRTMFAIGQPTGVCQFMDGDKFLDICPDSA